MPDRKNWTRIALCQTSVVAGLLLTSPTQASQKGWADASDVGVHGLTAVAIGLPLVNRDMPGTFQAAGSIGATKLLTYGLKETFPEWRPDHSDRKSFPSGHTSTAFAAAAALFNRHGQEVGIPALAVATFVGIARVKADKHHWYDAVAGAGLGGAVGFLITRERPEKGAMIAPWGDTKGGGISLAMRF